MHQRVTATRELIRRGWDTNCDAITPDDVAAYYERQEAREPTGYDNRLQEWREKERAAEEAKDKKPVGATGRSPHDEPQLEAGLFSHLSFAEIDRYEAMSAEEQADFVEKQRQYRASRRSTEAQHTVPSPSTGDPEAPSPLTGEGRDGRENPVHGEPVEPPVASSVHPESVEGPAQHTTPSPSSQLVIPAQAGIQWRGAGGEHRETINWNTLPQDDTLSTNTPQPTNPAKSQTHIRSP